MADAPVVHIGENSPEQVAYKLLKEIAAAQELRTIVGSGQNRPTKDWLLDTYLECLNVVRGYPRS